MARGRPDGRRAMLRDVPAQGVGHERPDELGGAQQRSQAARVGQHSTQEETLQPFAERSRAQSLDVGPADVEQARIFDARGAGGLAGAATQAAVEMDLGGAARLVPLQERLDEVDAPARAVQLVAQEPVGRAARRAETAMDATARRRARCPRRAGADPTTPWRRCRRGSPRFRSGAARSRTSDPAPPAALRDHPLGCPHVPSPRARSAHKTPRHGSRRSTSGSPRCPGQKRPWYPHPGCAGRCPHRAPAGHAPPSPRAHARLPGRHRTRLEGG